MKDLNKERKICQADWPQGSSWWWHTAQAAARQTHQHVGVFLGHIGLKPRPPLCTLPDLTKPTGTKKNEAVQWFGPSNGSVVLNTRVASNNNPRGWMISVLIFQFCLKLYNLDFTCCPCLQEHCLFCQAQTPQNSLLPPEFSTEYRNGQGTGYPRGVIQTPPAQKETRLN